MLRNCVAEPDEDFIKVPNVVRQQCDPSYYTIYMRKTSEYTSHEDEHGTLCLVCSVFEQGKDRFWCSRELF